MSKTIKIIDLLNKIANGEDIPKKIKLSDRVYYWDINDRCYVDEDMTNWVDNIDNKWLEARISIDSKKDLNKEVELIEEEPEIDIQNIQEYTIDELEYMCPEYLKPLAYKSNELIKAVKQLDKRITGDKTSDK